MQQSQFYIELLNALFIVAEKGGEELCLNPEDGKIYKVKERDKQSASLLSLSGDSALVVAFNPEKLIFRADIVRRSAQIGILTENNGITTGKKRDNDGIITGYDIGEQRITPDGKSDGKQIINVNGTVAERAVVGLGKVNLSKFADLYTGDIAATALQIEANADKILKATNKTETIKKVISLFESAKAAAQKQNLFRLKEIEKTLAGIVEKQKAMRAGVEKAAYKQQLKKTIIKCLTCAVLLSGLYLYFSHTGTPSRSPTLQTNSASVIFAPDIFEEACAEFEAETGRKIYPKGRECLRRACARCTTKNEILKIIKYNMNE